jgi:hypothetical protein
MPEGKFHISDQDLLLAIDGELSTRRQSRVESHLAACWTCRTRKQELESAIADFVRIHRRNLHVQIPPSDGPRALLKARMEQTANAQGTSWLAWFRTMSWRLSAAILATACALAALTYWTFEIRASHKAETVAAVFIPDPNLTPGATVLISRNEVCSASNANNKIVPVALQRRVFDEYRIGTARPNTYEVDYLITPALGGADDIHNLWPQSKRATLWNAEVKDALEDRLRDLVCGGQLDLATAQHEMAANWIATYKKYFHTDRPVSSTR